ncbi:MAG: hypothetical protein IKP07_02395 [Bacilli bacterium]|nr:hypothetical protein [Bacilli bacterium]
MKGNSGHFTGTLGGTVSSISSLQNMTPKDLDDNWKDTTNPKAKENGSHRTTYTNDNTGMVIHFDKGQKGKNGFAGKDHWHVENPNATGAGDAYLDIDGNPCPKNSKASHIVTKKGSSKDED